MWSHLAEASKPPPVMEDAPLTHDTELSSVPPDDAEDRSLRHELWGIGLLTLALCLFLALISYSSVDSGHGGGAVNLIGPVGAELANVMLEGIGLCAFFFDGVLFYCGFALLFGRQLRLSSQEGVGYGVAIPTGAVLLHLVFAGDRVLGHKAGGLIGELGAEIGRSLLGSVGTGILTVATMLLSLALITETNPSALAQRLTLWVMRGLGRGLDRLAALGLRGLRRAPRLAWRLLRRALRRTAEGESETPLLEVSFAYASGAAGEGPSLLGPDEDGPPPVQPRSTSSSRAPSAGTAVRGGDAAHAGPGGHGPDVPSGSHGGRRPRITIPDAIKRKTNESQLALELTQRDVRGFTLPATSLLSAPTVAQTAVDHAALQACAERLEQGLLEFKVKGQVTGITPGPVVTMFEFEPAAGVKLSTISNLSADLARVIRAQSVRIVAPIPGKGVVGLEVPNEARESVLLRELLEDRSFRETRCKLPLAVGKDISGNPVVSDLAKMPHLLVAGATGSGKSVAVNAMITSLLYHAPPSDIRLIMVDPKMLELSIYEDIPHLLVPVVTDPHKAATALKWAVNEMDRRYHLLKEMQVRNIGGYNRAIERLLEDPTAEVPDAFERDELGHPIIERLPFIVIVIDEFADLMMVASKDVEICVARLAQKARAAGVHLILATQRPSVDVITGLIKANFPTRISFRVFSRVDSRTVLDTQGAEHLLGMGDMLFRPPGRGDLVRVHGAYVDEKEILQVVEHLKAQGKPQYQEDILLDADASLEDLDADEMDEMYDLAVELVTRERKASISMVQRKLRVGYNRAARMIEMMEREGVVGPSDGRGTRDVLAPPPP
jgi:DNA segregation ATPase FtsK/SpoIIIE-like protein